MPRVRSGHVEQLVYRTRQWGALDPIWPVCLPIGLMLIVIDGVLSDGWATGVSGLFYCGAICIALGVAPFLWCSGATIDAARGEVIKWWGVVVPIRWRKFRLGPFRKVTVSAERRKSRLLGYRGWRASYIVYSVRLVGGGAFDLEVHLGRRRRKAKKIGEEVTALLDLPLVDRAGE